MTQTQQTEKFDNEKVGGHAMSEKNTFTAGGKSMQATYLRRPDGKWTGEAQLWEFSEPYRFDKDDETRFVVTSATRAIGVPETYIFPIDEHGIVLSWGELPGSYRGGLDHDEAIQGFCAAVNGRGADA